MTKNKFGIFHALIPTNFKNRKKSQYYPMNISLKLITFLISILKIQTVILMEQAPTIPSIF